MFGPGALPVVLGLLMLLVVLIVISLTSASVDGAQTHQNITIESNSEFTAQNGVSSGTGTPTDPYVIEDMVIVGTSSRGIWVRDTDAHLMIRNVTFSRDNGYTTGISLRNVTNCIVEDCTFTNLTYGLSATLAGSLDVHGCTFNRSTVRFAASAGVALTDSVIRDAPIGMEVEDVDGCFIEGCTFINATNKCCYVRGSVTNMTVVDCRFSDVDGYGFYTYTDPVPDHSLVFSRNVLTRCFNGVRVRGFDVATFLDNRLLEDINEGIVVSGATRLVFRNNSVDHRGVSIGFGSPDNVSVVFDNNTVGGRLILFLMDRHDVDVPADVGQVIALDCTGLRIAGIGFRETWSTVSLAWCDDVTVASCAFNDTFFGVSLDSCEGVVVRDNSFSGNNFGVAVAGSMDVSLVDNLFNGSDSGIDLQASRDVVIRDNSFVNCRIGVSRDTRDEEDACYSVRIVGNDLASTIVGCIMKNTHDVHVISNTFLAIGSTCFSAVGVSSLVVMDNQFTDCPLDSVDLQRCDGSTVANNTFVRVSSCIGIRDSDGVNVTWNMMIDTEEHGVRLYRATHANVSRNHVTGRSVPSLELYECSESVVHHNNVISSGPVLVWDEGGVNVTWDDGAEGNHWSDYEARYPNANRTGELWDVPYAVPGPSGSRDRFPLADILDLRDPVADAGEDVTVDEGTEVSLDASGSYDDVGIVSFTWTFVHGGSPVELQGSSTVFTFIHPGCYTVNLTVTDKAGRSSTDSLVVTVLDVLDPVADAGGDRSVDVLVPVELDGSASHDTGGIVAYNWTITMDGETIHLDGARVTFTFDALGEHEVTLRVTDPAGRTGVDTVTVTVVDITGPEAIIQAADAVDQGETVHLDGSASSDNVEVTSFIWTFDYRGAPILLEGSTVEFTFETAGVYVITLTVEDGSGNEATASHQLTVRDVTPPVANPGTDRSTPQGVEYVLRDFGSTDDTGVTGHTWSFTVDGEEVVREGEEVTYTFLEPGVYTITLTVADAAGNTGSASFDLTVLDTEAPVAVTPGDLRVRAGREVVLDASGSTDNVGVVGYTWEFRHAGVDEVLQGASVPFTFKRAGDVEVTLTVRDAAGNEDTDHFSVRVEGKDDGDGGTIWPFVAIVIVTVVVVVLAVYMMRRGKEQRGR